MISANCPNCGAPVTLQWHGAVQTTCPFCRSILVRRDVNLLKVGQAAEMPSEGSPIQIATEGTWEGKTFTVVGRILYEWAQGSWNEWHIVFSDSSSGWLSDAQSEFAVSRLAEPAGALPTTASLAPGQNLQLAGKWFQVTVLTRARYAGVEGELPFTTWDKHEALFADLRSTTADFATLDYSGEPSLLYVGTAAAFDQLHLKNVRQFEGWS